MASSRSICPGPTSPIGSGLRSWRLPRWQLRILDQAPWTAPCHLGGGKRANAEPTEPGARGAVAAPGLFLDEPREGDAEREMRGGTRDARGSGRGAQGRGHTHAPTSGNGGSVTPALLRTFIFKRFLRIATPSLAMNTSRKTLEIQRFAYQLKKLPQVGFGGFTFFSSRFHFCGFWALTLIFVKSHSF